MEAGVTDPTLRKNGEGWGTRLWCYTPSTTISLVFTRRSASRSQWRLVYLITLGTTRKSRHWQIEIGGITWQRLMIKR